MCGFSNRLLCDSCTIHLSDSGELFDETPSQTTRCSQLRSFSPKTSQEGLAVGIDKRHAPQVDLRTMLLMLGQRAAIGVEFGYPWTRQASFDDQRNSSPFILLPCDFQHEWASPLAHADASTQLIPKLQSAILQDNRINDFTALHASSNRDKRRTGTGQ